MDNRRQDSSILSDFFDDYDNHTDNDQNYINDNYCFSSWDNTFASYDDEDLFEM